MADYRVISQVPTVFLDPVTGQPVNGWRVGFQDLVTNVAGTVSIPDDQYGAAEVNQAIMERIATIRQVHALGQ